MSAVLVTGAAGRIGRAIRPYLQEHYRLRLHDRAWPEGAAPADADTLTGDIRDLDALREAMAEVEAVVHLAGNPTGRASWQEARDHNIDGTYSVYEAARRAGVRKVVFASTNHVTGMYDRDEEWPIHPDQPVRPDSYYGVSKACGEALARYYADEAGMSMICLRIGSFRDRPVDLRTMRMWASPRDLAQLVHRAIQADVRFGIYYGMSANTRLQHDLGNARAELGYEPVDDSEAFAAELLG